MMFRINIDPYYQQYDKKLNKYVNNGYLKTMLYKYAFGFNQEEQLN